jgi:hypothetical protein
VSNKIRCARCGKALLVAEGVSCGQLTCPRCLACIANLTGEVSSSLPSATPDQRQGLAAHGVRGDTILLHTCLPVVTLLCILGIVYLHVWWKEGMEDGEELLALALVFLILDIVVPMQVFLWIFRPTSPRSVLLRESFLPLLGSVLLLMALAGAAVVFFFLACGALYETSYPF